MKEEDFEILLKQYRKESGSEVVYLPDHQFKRLEDNPICHSVRVGNTWYMRESDRNYGKRGGVDR